MVALAGPPGAKQLPRCSAEVEANQAQCLGAISGLAAFRREIAKGRANTSAKAVSRYTTVGEDGLHGLISRPPSTRWSPRR